MFNSRRFDPIDISLHAVRALGVDGHADGIRAVTSMVAVDNVPIMPRIRGGIFIDDVVCFSENGFEHVSYIHNDCYRRTTL